MGWRPVWARLACSGRWASRHGAASVSSAVCASEGEGCLPCFSGSQVEGRDQEDQVLTITLRIPIPGARSLGLLEAWLTDSPHMQCWERGSEAEAEAAPKPSSSCKFWAQTGDNTGWQLPSLALVLSKGGPRGQVTRSLFLNTGASDSLGLEGEGARVGISTKSPGVLIGWGPHFENHCLTTPEKTGAVLFPFYKRGN